MSSAHVTGADGEATAAAGTPGPWPSPWPWPWAQTPVPGGRAGAATRRRGRLVSLVSRRRLQVALAVLWLLDGALQLQPFMFTKGFADQVIAPAAAGQPAVVAAAVHWSATLIAAHPAIWDAAFAAAQLAIGVGLLLPRTVRIALVASVAWAVGVWLFGEGLGGVAGGTTTFVSGAPGAVILYAVIGLAAWPGLVSPGPGGLLPRKRDLRHRVVAPASSPADSLPSRWVPAAWASVWVLFAALQALPGNDRSSAVGAALATNARTAPGWLGHAERTLDAALSHQGSWPVVALVVADVVIGLLALRQGRPRQVAAVAGIAVAMAVWVVGQAFGQIATGTGTDPNSGPLVALLGLAVLARRRSAVAAPGASGSVRPAPTRTSDGTRRADVA